MRRFLKVSMKRKTKPKFSIGDKVEVIGVPPFSLSPGVRDTIGTKKLFKSMLWKVYTVKAFDEYQNVELHPTRSDHVWIEPEYLNLQTKKDKRRK